MNYLENRIARKEYLPMPEEAQRKFEKFEEAFGEKEVKEDNLIQNFATGVISGAISAPIAAIGIPSVVAPTIISATHGRIRTVQVFNDESSRLLVRHEHGNNSNKSRGDDPGFFTYMVGVAFTGLGILLSGTPAGPILIGVGTGLLGTGVSISGEAKAEQSRNRNRRE